MSAQTRELYHSANGDRWYLAYDRAAGRAFVRHEPNLASGGKISEVEIGAFLSQGGQGPEKLELLRLIGTLVVQETPSNTRVKEPASASLEAAGIASSTERAI
jgi:hypothetical protein